MRNVWKGNTSLTLLLDIEPTYLFGKCVNFEMKLMKLAFFLLAGGFRRCEQAEEMRIGEQLIYRTITKVLLV